MVRGLGGRLLLLGGALALSFLLAELVLRVHYRLTWTGSIASLHAEPPMPEAGSAVSLGQMLRPSPHPRLVYELKPGLDVRFVRVRVETSPAGWREEPYPPAKPAGAIRILGIGDSTMFGWGVAVAERYMDLLEKRLRRERPEARWEAIVTAVPGYNLVMELESLERYGLAYRPDLIVYGWNPNDHCLPDFLLPEKDLWAATSFVADYARSLGVGAPSLHRRPRTAATSCLDREAPERYRRLAGRDAFAAALDRLAAVSAQASIPAVLVTDFASHFEDMMAMVLPPGLLYVATVSRTASGARGELRLGRRDPHPSAAGHRILAEALFEDLKAAGVWDDLAMNLERARRNAAIEEPAP